MLTTTAPAYSIRLIDEVTRADGGACVTFRDGTLARLESSQANFEHLHWLAEWSRPNRPVGVVTDATGRIIDLNAAHQTGVAWVRDVPANHGRLRVALWAYSPICALTREHPEFDRIHATLTAAGGTQQQCWVVTHSEETVDDEPDEEGLIAALPKIMDVRPISSPSPNGDLLAATDRPRNWRFLVLSDYPRDRADDSV
jgi:hypothetical protein